MAAPKAFAIWESKENEGMSHGTFSQLCTVGSGKDAVPAKETLLHKS